MEKQKQSVLTKEIFDSALEKIKAERLKIFDSDPNNQFNSQQYQEFKQAIGQRHFATFEEQAQFIMDFLNIPLPFNRASEGGMEQYNLVQQYFVMSQRISDRLDCFETMPNTDKVFESYKEICDIAVEANRLQSEFLSVQFSSGQQVDKLNNYTNKIKALPQEIKSLVEKFNAQFSHEDDIKTGRNIYVKEALKEDTGVFTFRLLSLYKGWKVDFFQNGEESFGRKFLQKVAVFEALKENDPDANWDHQEFENSFDEKLLELAAEKVVQSEVGKNMSAVISAVSDLIPGLRNDKPLQNRFLEILRQKGFSLESNNQNRQNHRTVAKKKQFE